MLKVLDLFSGIGGFSLGLERTGGFETVAFCEIDPFCQKILKKHWPTVPIFNDVKDLNYEGEVDVITGGFPCQPFSTASRGRKTAEDLWPIMANTIKKYNPKIWIAENVQRECIERAADFARVLGYSVAVKCIGAHDAGADHKRNRWWLCAHPYDQSEFYSSLDAEVASLPQLCFGLWGRENYARTFRISNGLSNRMDRFRSLGNTVLPQIPQIIGNVILRLTPSTQAHRGAFGWMGCLVT